MYWNQPLWASPFGLQPLILSELRVMILFVVNIASMSRASQHIQDSFFLYILWCLKYSALIGKSFQHWFHFVKSKMCLANHCTKSKIISYSFHVRANPKTEISYVSHPPVSSEINPKSHPWFQFHTWKTLQCCFSGQSQAMFFDLNFKFNLEFNFG